MTQDHAATGRVSLSFAAAAEPAKPVHPKKPSPFSLRLSSDERAYLEARAGGRPLGVYIRDQLLGGKAQKRQYQRKPRIDDRQAAMLLAELGHSRLSSNLNQLAKHANTGSLDVSPEVEKELHDAYLAVLAMRDALMTALGSKVGGGQ